MRLRTLTRPPAHYYWPHWAGLAWLTIGLMMLLMAASCRQGVPALDTTPGPPPAGATLGGTVRGPGGATPVDGRTVEVINVTTNERQRAATDDTGTFSLQLSPGDYRVELVLREGEAIVRQPGLIHLNRTDVDTHADFILAVPGDRRISRPRRPAYRIDDGLGSPVA